MDRPFVLLGTRPVIGRLRGGRLRARKRIWYKNSFQTFLSAKLFEHEGGTRIRCRFSMHPIVAAFMIFWLAGVALIGGAICVQSLRMLASSHPLPEIWAGVAIPVVMLVFGFGLVRFGRHLARGEQQFLIDFLRDVVDAHESL